MKTWVVFLVCLTATACFHSVDGTKVKCTNNDHCPNNFVCSGGKCVGSSTSTDARSSETAPVTADTKSVGSDVASGPDAEGVADASDLALDLPLLGTGGVGGSGGTGVGGSIGGAPGSGGVIGSGGAVPNGGAPGTGGVLGSGGSTPSGGAVATGGINSTGGVASSGGISSTGGVLATGGIPGTGGTTCQPKPRDCTSALDNDCNGTPDKQETTFCACPVGEARPCQEHPGYDGTGICKAGSQTCAASADKTSSSWGTCSGAVGPGTEVCDAAGLDENCNGQSNEGCDCVNGASIPCDCGPATTCTNGKKGTCSVSKVTMYPDSDHDGYGNATKPAMVCPGTSGYVTNADDCDDGDATFKPGVSVCLSDTQRRWCPTTGAISQTEPCDDGCFKGTGACRNDGTVGLPGFVTCGSFRCRTSDGCNAGGCGGSVACDGPSDCSTGDVCWTWNTRDGTSAACLGAGQGGDYVVCDPMANTCNCKLQELSPGISLYVCP